MLLMFTAFILKHFLCDFPLQVPFMYLNKGKYGHLGGLLHAATHGFFTMVVLAVFGVSLEDCIHLALLDAGIHYHVDWVKTRVTQDNNLTTKDAAFWAWIGIDQMLHYLTYVAIIYLATPV